MNFIGTIFFLNNVILLLVFWAATLGVEKTKRGKRFGIYIPSERLNDERVLEICDAYKRQNKLWLSLGLLTSLLPLVPTVYFSITFSIFMIWTGLIIFLKLKISAQAMKALKTLKSTQGWENPEVDADEKNWHWGGVIYYNPSSDKLFKASPEFPASYTFNLATKAGKISWFLIGALLVGTLLPAWGMIIIDDIFPPRMTFSETEFSIKSGFSRLSVPLSQIESVQWAEDLSIGSKQKGSSTALYKRGTFSIRNLGKAHVYIFNDISEQILINLSEDRPILLNMKSLEETQRLYEELKNASPAP